MQIYTQSTGNTGFPPVMTTTTHPYFWMNAAGQTGISMYPKGLNRLSVGGYTYLNGNTQVTTALRISSNTMLTPTDWAPANFPYTFSVDNGDANFAGSTLTRSAATVNGYALFNNNVQIGAMHPAPA